MFAVGRTAPVLLVCTLLELLGWTSAQFLLYNGNNQLIFGSQGLQAALRDDTVGVIVLSGNITISSATWVTPPVVANRSLLIVGSDTSNVTNVLNFGGTPGALVIGEGADVEFRNLTLKGAAAQNVSSPQQNYVQYKAAGLALWPSLVVLDGATILFNATALEYYSQILWSQCQNFASKVRYQLQQLGYGTSISSPNPTSLFVSGWLNVTSNITDITTNKLVGEAAFDSRDTMLTCVSDPFPQDRQLSGATKVARTSGSSGFKWWYGLLIAIGAVILLAAVALVALAVFVRRRRHQRQQGQLPVTEADRDLKGPLPSAPLTPGGSTAASEETKPASLRPSSSIAATHASTDLDGCRAPNASQVSMEALGSAGGMANGSGRTDQSLRSDYAHDMAALPDQGNAFSGGGNSSAGGLNNSGGQNSSHAPWSDVTALLRARSDFSDIELGPLIGRGSFGRVYKGRWKGAFVAIKIVDHQEAASKVIAMREGALSHSVQHPNVITTYSVFLQRTPSAAPGESEGWAGDRSVPEDAMEGVPERSDPSFTEDHDQFATCMVLEYADRGTLEKAVIGGRFRKRNTGLPDLNSIHRTLLDIAGGMSYLHSVGVLHGDLKGANVLLKSTATDTRGFTCKLADFGMARLLDTNRTHVSTQTYGTISYMPPELLKEGKLTRAVDAYSFAILMWELFSGMILHTGLTMAQVFYKICYEQQQPPIPPGMPEEYADLMRRCWDVDSTKRPTFVEIFSHLHSLPTLKNGPRESLSTTGSTVGSPSRKESGASPKASQELPSPFAAAATSLPASPCPLPGSSSAEAQGPNPLAKPADQPAGGSAGALVGKPM